ncbi:membrane protein [Phaeobacter gallaeciensis]|jgi:uncharacterized membrane protein YedE/YeeE|uniref:Membrane protein n=1 Tax=Phaeobacter gallaeciensis TaxID=60890 RepID=A0A1B0ZMR7_9RHOB|nr:MULTISPECIES: DUF6691 family protein [Phaeobacter]MDF1771171.1 hypothetical protein [Pseudophaeobacter sp. bin_em_oilr2.035]MEE2634306.1 DUF6691 family protein [Pseudomonadota bacterium]ANP35408.1 membrane protein [Phaeobacter gallaeciensis]MDE4062046.1 hypothetical protein [Phaeobacter gallaeciensis]MDE4099034.1 hypothetical protein [Phaeobacter gallaeciensis]
MRILLSLIAGSLFGGGLFISGMTDTTKVQGWLDVFGNWDPTLAFVMGGAVIPMFFAWRLTHGRKPLVGGDFPTLPRPELDHRLITGSVLFGMGWGLAGLCPGPALASLTYNGWGGLIFLAAMSAGMLASAPIGVQLDRMAAKA